MQHDVSGCAISICNNVEYVDNEESYMNFMKDVV